MTGKVFHDSANVYQDQAKILFEYRKHLIYIHYIEYHSENTPR